MNIGNNMSKNLSLFTALLCSALLIPFAVLAKHSDQFLLGTYSSLTNISKDDIAIQDSLCSDMQKLGYNANVMNTTVNDKQLPGLMKKMDDYGLDAILLDFGWNASRDNEHRYATYAISVSNYLKFEAEFSSEADVKPGDRLDSSYWYAMRDLPNQPRQGKKVMTPGMSYDWAWEALRGRDKAGHILTDIRYRWPNPGKAYLRFGSDFTIYQNNPPTHEGEYIWIKYRFRINKVDQGLAPDTPLLRFYIAGYELSGGGYSFQEKVVSHYKQDLALSESIFRLSDYQASLSADGFAELQIKVPYRALIEANLLTADTDLNPATPDSGNRLRLINLNPRVYWYGNCDVQLDYVEMQDQAHYDFVNDKAWWREKVAERMRSVISQSPGNLKSFYSWDEPHLGQFDSFNLLQEFAEYAGTDLFTAVFDHQRLVFTLDPSSNARYNHVDAFLNLAKPKIIAPDIYPVIPDIAWNGPSSDNKVFIQDQFSDKLLSVYRMCKIYRDADKDRDFYPIIQVLGNWVKSGEQERWISWIQPPLATQKAMLYLPLCFGPDGVIHFSHRAVQNQSGYGYKAVTFSRRGTPTFPYPQKDPIAWTAVESTNFRVLRYGKLLRGFKWLESETLGTKASKGRTWHAANLVKSAGVEKAQDGPYTGYIECAYYQDDYGTPWFMAVNRRTNFFVPGAISDPALVPAEEFDTYFPEAKAQILVLTFHDRAFKRYGGRMALFDPADRVFYPVINQTAKVTIPAGEGRLLKLVALPPVGGFGPY
jgi:hypothetical protein